MKTKLLLFLFIATSLANAQNVITNLTTPSITSTTVQISFYIQNNCVNGYYTAQLSTSSAFTNVFYSTTTAITDCSGSPLLKTINVMGLNVSTTYYYRIIAGPNTDPAFNPDYSSSSFFTTFNSPITIAEYNFDNTYNNQSGNSPFSANAGLAFVTGRDGVTANGALSITGTGTTASISNLPFGSSPRTFSVWIKLNVINGSGFNFIYHYGENGTGNGLYLTQNNAIHFPLSPSNHIVSASTVVNTWYHYVVIYDGTYSKIYRNGALINSTPKTVNTGVNAIANLFRLGLSENGSTGYFSGAIDDLKIYNYALTDAQVLNLYNNNSILSSNTFNQNNLEVSLYPNPANDVLNIDMTNEVKSIEIYNIQGQKVLESSKKQINVSDLASGMYMVKIQDAENSITTKKVIIK